MRRPQPLRSLPRVFLPGVDPDGPIELPAAELDKLRKVLRLSAGAEIAVLPNDGSLIRCEFTGRTALPISVEWPRTEPSITLTIAQALPKGDRLETVVRMGTEIGVSRFLVFPAARSVVKWEESKRATRLARLEAIIRESAEQSFRSKLPTLEWRDSTKAILVEHPDAIVLNESEGETATLSDRLSKAVSPVIVVGPEGGWDQSEQSLIANRGATLGPLVLRTDTAGVAAASIALLPRT